MNKRLKEILKEYEERKHKIIKGDESMNIVVLAGGTSTEREISIVTGTGMQGTSSERTQCHSRRYFLWPGAGRLG